MPSKEELIENLRRAYENDKSRSLSGQIRSIFDEISSLREGGMSLASIASVLSDQGVSVTDRSLSHILFRIRARQNAKQKKTTPARVERVAVKPNVVARTDSKSAPIGAKVSRDEFARQFEVGGMGPLGRFIKKEKEMKNE